MEYHVAPYGDDTAEGTAERPFQTLAGATEALTPGDECIIHEGVYRETLRPARSGEPGRPIVYRAADGEAPVVSACDPVRGWRDEGDGLWSGELPIDLADGNQLFAGLRMLPEARWPKDTGDLFSPVRSRAAEGSPTTLTDPSLGELGLASGGLDGALLWCSGGAKWICWAAPVEKLDPKSHTLTFSTDVTGRHWYVPCEGSEYVLMGSRALLTDPWEWCVDSDSGRLLLMLPEGASPVDAGAEEVVEAKARRTAIDLSGRAHVQLVGLHFCGGGLRSDAESRDLRLERLHGRYVAHSYAQDRSEEAVLIDGENHIVRECDFGYSSGSVVRVAGRRHKVLGNLIHHGDYTGLWRGTMSVTGRNHVVAYNTMRYSGRDLLSIHGLTESLIEHNDLSFAGLLTHDLGITYGHNTDFGGTLIRRNHVHDCVAAGLAEGIYFDHCSHNVIVCENLIWNIPAMPIQVNNPGHFNLIAHNSCYRTNTVREAITSFDHSHRQDLYGCRFLNNIVNAPFKLPENAVVEGNLVCEDPGYVDPEHGGLKLGDDRVETGPVVPISGLNRFGAPEPATMETRAEAAPPTIPGALQPGSEVWHAGHDSGVPIDESVEWVRLDWTYTNRLSNAAFELGTLEGWRLSHSGAARIVAGNGWGNTVAGTEAAPTGTSRYEVELGGTGGGRGSASDRSSPPDVYIEQQVAGLPAGTRFALSGWVRADGGVPVTLSVFGEGLETVAAESATPEWTRLVVELTTPGEPGGSTTVTVRISREPGTTETAARVDNLGLVETE